MLTRSPKVFVTVHSDFGSRAQSTLSGGNDFIAKPFLSAELAIKAFTCLFKKNLQLAGAGTHELPASADHVAPNVREEPVLEPKTAL
jgi:FixJ family two-component response regulator